MLRHVRSMRMDRRNWWMITTAEQEALYDMSMEFLKAIQREDVAGAKFFCAKIKGWRVNDSAGDNIAG